VSLWLNEYLQIFKFDETGCLAARGPPAVEHLKPRMNLYLKCFLYSIKLFN